MFSMEQWCSGGIVKLELGPEDGESSEGRGGGGCCCCLEQARQRERGLKGFPAPKQELTSLVDSPGKGAQGPGPQAWAAREVGRPGDNVSPMVGAGPGICPERQPVGLNLQ